MVSYPFVICVPEREAYVSQKPPPWLLSSALRQSKRIR
jgi:hypothetical protein